VDAIQFILKDHRDIERLFKELERADRADAPDRAAGAIRELVRELSTHAVIEEQYLYPALREAGADARVLDALEEHHAAKLTLSELEALPASHPRFGSKLRVLTENVRRHVAEEESELLPLLERSLDDGQRRELGAALERAKSAAPTRPHPAAPDTPPGIFVAGAVASVYDRSRDALRGGTDVLRTLGVQGATRTVEGARKLAQRARERGRDAARTAAEQGRAAVNGAATKGREAVDQARESTARLQMRGADAASTVSRAARSSANRTRPDRRPARRRPAGSRKRSET
jgi:hemerythrin-like domain-containing protein